MALYSRVKTWVSNEVLTAANLNAEFDNILTNSAAASMVGYSANTTQMRLTADPGGVGTESLASSVAEELTRIRYVLKRIVGGAQWYSTPDFDLTGTLSTSNIADGAITQAKRAALTFQASSSTSSFSTTSTSFTDVTNASVSFTGTGRQLVIGLRADGSTDAANAARVQAQSGSTGVAYLQFLVASSVVAVYAVPISDLLNYMPPAAFTHVIGNVAAGTNTIKAQMKVDAGTTTGSVLNCQLYVYEL